MLFAAPGLTLDGGNCPMKRLRVLMIAPTSFFADYGCHVRIYEEASILQKMGHEVVICTYNTGQDVKGLRIERAMGIPWHKRVEVGSSLHKVAFDLFLSLKASLVALRWKPDIVHGHLHEGALIGFPLNLMRRVPLLFDFQGSLTSEMIDHHFLRPDGPFYRPMRRLEEVINGLPQAIITNSQHARSLLTGEFGCDEKRIHIVPDCVNPDIFQPLPDEGERLALKSRLGIPRERKVVVYLGLLAGYQGTGLLLEAIAHGGGRFADTHFLIMGYPAASFYQRRAKEMGIGEKVTFTGRIPYFEAPRYLAVGDVAVAPKLSATEGNGKILNYMSMALPTVAFDTPVNREYLDKWGIYVEWGNHVAFAEALISLLEDEERALELGRQLRKRAIECYSWEGAGKEIVRVYEVCTGS